MTHATPAALYARTAHRDWECDRKMPEIRPAKVKYTIYSWLHRVQYTIYSWLPRIQYKIYSWLPSVQYTIYKIQLVTQGTIYNIQYTAGYLGYNIQYTVGYPGYNVQNGVRQGAVSSPVLFCIYIDKIIKLLRCSTIGC